MSEMIERVMLILVNTRRSRFNIPLLDDLKHLTDEAFKDYEVQAKAAIEAMKEPTEKMLQAGSNCKVICNDGLGINAIYKDMIDAALKE